MLLESLTKHPSRSTADHISKSISRGSCGTVNYRAVPTTSKQQPLCRNSSLTVGLAIGCFSPVAKQIRIDQ